MVCPKNCSFDIIYYNTIFDANKNNFKCKKVVTLVIHSLLDDNDVNVKIDFIKANNIDSVKFSFYDFQLENNVIINFINQLPHCVKYFTFNLYKSIVDSEYVSSFSNLPYDLKYLDLNSYCNFYIDMLPMGLKSLSLGYDFTKPLDNLPNGLESLHIEGIYNHTLDNLPDSIKYLHLNLNKFTLPITKLPNSLVYLELKLDFNSIEYILQNVVYPDTLETFAFLINNMPPFREYGYMYDISKLNFPKKLKAFILGQPVNSILNKFTIPENTEILHLNMFYDLDNLIEMPDSVKKCYINTTQYEIDNVRKKLNDARARFPNCQIIANTVE